MTINEFTSSLIMPPEDCNPVVMWFWNGKITESDIKRHIAAFREQGITEFFIHPMYGLEVEYLSPEFFSLIKVAVSEAKKNKMRYWIYDEYNWPSGIAGGKVLREGNWAKSKVLSRVQAEVAEGERWSGTVEKFVAAHFRRNGITEDVTSQITYEKVSGGEKVSFKNNGGDGVLFVTYRHIQTKVGCNAMWCKYATNEGGYVDVFNPKAIEAFIKYTYEEYKKAIGNEFGKTVRGIFNDEPAFTDFDDTSNGLIPWSENFREQFKIRNCYDILSKIYLLFENNETEEEIILKRDYRDTLGELFRKSYIENVSDWAKKNKLEFTAHLLGEEFLTAHTEQFGSFLEAERYFTVPAIDSVFSAEFVDYERFNVSAAMLDSTAHWLCKSKTLCETYTGSNWDLHLSKMKRIANRLMMQGVTTLMYMGCYNSIEGMKKYYFACYPPSHGPNNILFRNYGMMSDYVSRLSAIVRSSVKSASVLVLYPTTTAAVTSKNNYIHTWEYSIKDFHDTTTYRQMDATVTATINALIRNKITFEIAFEELFEKCRISFGGICFTLPDGTETAPYDTLVIPAVKYVRKKTAEIINEFSEKGGKIIVVNETPKKEIDSFETVKAFEKFNNGFEAACASVKGFPDDKRTEFFEMSSNIKGIVTNEVSVEECGKLSEVFNKAFTKLLHKETAEIKGDDGIIAFRRKIGKLGVYLIANDKNEPQTFTITLDSEKKAAVYDIDKGIVIYEFNRRKEITLDGYEGIAIFAGDFDTVSELEMGLEKKEPTETENETELTDFRFNAENGNTLRLDWKIAEIVTEGKNGKEIYNEVIAVPEDKLRAERDKMIQVMSGDLPHDSDFVLKSEFNVVSKPKKLELVVEMIYGLTVVVNGSILKNGSKTYIWDNSNTVFDVSKFVTEGVNTIVAYGRTPDFVMPYTPPFVAVRGPFCLDSDNAVVSQYETKLGSWTENGYPEFSGMGVYSAKVRFGGKNKILRLLTDDCAAVFVNNSFVGERGWKPYDFDISPYIKHGDNDIKIYITPTMSNIFAKPVKTGIEKVYILDKKNK